VTRFTQERWRLEPRFTIWSAWSWQWSSTPEDL